jgi:hypothetical protein
MKVSREDSLTQAFVLGGEDLENLRSRLETSVSKLSLEIKCKDSLKREFTTVQELVQFENSPPKEISALRVMGLSDDLKTHFWVRFENDSPRNIFLSIQADEAVAVLINDAIEETLSAIKPWYSVVARADLFWVLTAVILGPSLLLMLAVAVGIIKIDPSQPFPFSAALPTLIRGSLIGLVPLVLGVVLNRMKRSVFPMGVFTIGQGAKRHKDKEMVRTVIVVAFFVSLASSLIATLFMALWRWA